MFSFRRRISNIFLTKYCDCLWLSTRKTDTATRLLSIFVGKQDKENGNETAANNTNADENDSFTNEFLKNRIQITEMQRLILCAGSSIASLIDPRRHDMIACLGETTGVSALENNLEKMEISSEGQRILAERPRINSRAINLDALAELPESTFGYHYKKFLDDNKVTPDSRMEVRFLPNPKLAYIMTRYRECHDLIHTILGMPTNMLGEVSVKWVEAINIGLPMCYGGAVFGAIRLRPKQRADYVRYYLPWALHCGRNSKPLLSIYWEQRWEQDINELRSELNIKPFTKTASIT